MFIHYLSTNYFIKLLIESSFPFSFGSHAVDNDIKAHLRLKVLVFFEKNSVLESTKVNASQFQPVTVDFAASHQLVIISFIKLQNAIVAFQFENTIS